MGGVREEFPTPIHSYPSTPFSAAISTCREKSELPHCTGDGHGVREFSAEITPRITTVAR